MTDSTFTRNTRLTRDAHPETKNNDKRAINAKQHRGHQCLWQWMAWGETNGT